MFLASGTLWAEIAEKWKGLDFLENQACFYQNFRLQFSMNISVDQK